MEVTAEAHMKMRVLFRYFAVCLRVPSHRPGDVASRAVFSSSNTVNILPSICYLDNSQYVGIIATWRLVKGTMSRCKIPGPELQGL